MIIPDAPISLLIADNGEMVIRRPPGFREEPDVAAIANRKEL